MNQWQQTLIWQASVALHAVFLAYGSKYFTPQEQAASNLMIDALIDLPRRVHAGNTPPATTYVVQNYSRGFEFPIHPEHAPKKIGRPKKKPTVK